MPAKAVAMTMSVATRVSMGVPPVVSMAMPTVVISTMGVTMGAMVVGVATVVMLVAAMGVVMGAMIVAAMVTAVPLLMAVVMFLTVTARIMGRPIVFFSTHEGKDICPMRIVNLLPIVLSIINSIPYVNI